MRRPELFAAAPVSRSFWTEPRSFDTERIKNIIDGFIAAGFTGIRVPGSRHDGLLMSNAASGMAGFDIDCTGDACVGDEILFTERVYGAYGRRAPLGQRRVAARIVSDSYGAEKQQHTFSLVVLASDGYAPIDIGTLTRRKGRNVYRRGTRRRAWPDEAARLAVLADKHARGESARAARTARIEAAVSARRTREGSLAEGLPRPARSAKRRRARSRRAPASPERERSSRRQPTG